MMSQTGVQGSGLTIWWMIFRKLGHHMNKKAALSSDVMPSINNKTLQHNGKTWNFLLGRDIFLK